MEDKVLVVIPYVSMAAQGNELELAVAGWRKHFREPHQIVVVGNPSPVVHSGDDITYIPCPRLEPVPGQYTPHLDIVAKFRLALEAFPEAGGIIYTCDDIYAVKDFDLATIQTVKRPKDFIIPDFNWERERERWMGDLGKTAALCKREGYNQLNFVCHLPVYYKRDWLEWILNKYDCDHESYIVENIYFNIDPDNFMAAEEAKNYQYMVETANPGIRTASEADRVWICNANSGWSERLEDILRRHYER